MKCPKCTIDLPDDARFCGGCGYRYTETIKVFSGKQKIAVEEDISKADPAFAALVKTPIATRKMTPAEFQTYKNAYRPKSGEFEKALLHACEQKKIPPILNKKIFTRDDFEKQGKSLGLNSKEMAQSLHRVSLEKVAWDDVSDKMKTALGYEVPQDLGDKSKLKMVFGILGVCILLCGILFFAFQKKAEKKTVVALKGHINAEKLQESLSKVVPLIRDCYSEALKKEDLSSGALQIRFEIGLDAKVSQVELRNTEFSSLKPCIESSFAQVQMPKAENLAMKVDLPLELKATETVENAAVEKKVKTKKKTRKDSLLKKDSIK